jgi:hypothetical protein
MPTSCLRLIEYRTEDGARFKLEVSAAIAAVLRAEEAPLKESPFADVAIKGEYGEVVPLDPDQLDSRTQGRRVAERPMPQGNPWEGPRFSFPLLLGEHRPGWNGGVSIDERGRCGICHGLRLPSSAYCLSCDRSGRDREIPTPPEQVRRRRPKDGRLKGGLAGKR